MEKKEQSEGRVQIPLYVTRKMRQKIKQLAHENYTSVNQYILGLIEREANSDK